MHVLCLILLLATAAPAHDLKITTVKHSTETETTANGQKRVIWQETKTQTEYAKGQWRRRDINDFWGELPPYPKRVPHAVTIENCDFYNQAAFTLDLDTREYRKGILPNYPPTLRLTTPLKVVPTENAPSADFPEVQEPETKVTDTGESKEIFGYTAYHVITRTSSKQSVETADRRFIRELVQDGWYINLQPVFGCRPPYHNQALDRDPAAKHNRLVVNGFPVKQRTIYRSWPTSDGRQRERVYEVEVMELSQEPLDPALFRVPPGFKLVDHLFRDRLSCRAGYHFVSGWEGGACVPDCPREYRRKAANSDACVLKTGSPWYVLVPIWPRMRATRDWGWEAVVSDPTPLVTKRVGPIYPELARAARVQGRVHFLVLGKEDGNIQLQLTSGHPLLADSARHALDRWQWRPILLQGHPVQFRTRIFFDFELRPSGPRVRTALGRRPND